jgi:hypothetical protein
MGGNRRTARGREVGRHLVAVTCVVAALASARPARASDQLVAARLCRKAFDIEGRAYALKRTGLVLRCADQLLKCELMDEIDGDDPSDCRAAATSGCVSRLSIDPNGTLGKAALRFDANVGAACFSPAFPYAEVLSTGPGGLWFANDAACAGAVDLPSFLPCLRGELDARLDAVTSESKPRMGILLDNAGLGAAFSGLARPPFDDVVVAATAPASGTLVAPGTITVAAGTALRFTGDAATLPCGASTIDGRVTVTVGSGPTASFHVLAEPYAATSLAIFGPFATSGTVPYTIALKDGSCQGTVSGSVVVP